MSRWESRGRDDETAVGIATKGARGSSGVLVSKGWDGPLKRERGRH